jgi:hypothetical protein
MIKRLRESSSKGNLPNRHDPQTGRAPSRYAEDPDHDAQDQSRHAQGRSQYAQDQSHYAEDRSHHAQDRSRYGDPGLLTPRSAGILGASVAVAACAGGLTYLSLGHLSAGLPAALLAAGAAFAGAIRLLDAIIA